MAAGNEEAPRISAEVAASLAKQGWAVVDGFFSENFAEGLRDEIVTLAATGAMLPNKTYFANPSGGRYLFSKPHIWEVDLHQDDVKKEALPCLQRWFALSSTQWAESLQQALPSWELLTGNDARTVKLQWNRGTAAGGGSFPCHYDNPGPPSKRALTCVVYLNPEWKDGDGGEIVLRPFLGQPIAVAPRMNRAVLFASDWMLHSVQPSFAERFCITTWMDGDGVNLPEHLTLRLPPTAMQDLEGTAALLRTSPCQRLLSRAIDREVYEATLVACMKGANGLQEMMSAHKQHVEASEKNAPLWRLVEALRGHRERLRGEQQQQPAPRGELAGGAAAAGPPSAEGRGAPGPGTAAAASPPAQREAGGDRAGAGDKRGGNCDGGSSSSSEGALVWEPLSYDRGRG